jgi:hypothetical protein
MLHRLRLHKRSTIACITAALFTLIAASGIAVQTGTASAADPSPTWTFCANEGATCAFTGTKQVRYGANGTYTVRTVTGSVACTNATFGDPLFGVVKHCDVAEPTCSPGQKLSNPGFENADSWLANDDLIRSISSAPAAHSGKGLAWLGGYGAASAYPATISQIVTIPAGCTNSTLSFWLNVETAETTTTDRLDELQVSMFTCRRYGCPPLPDNHYNAILADLSNLDRTDGWVLRTFNLGKIAAASGFAGQTVELMITATENASRATSFKLDDFALTAA